METGDRFLILSSLEGGAGRGRAVMVRIEEVLDGKEAEERVILHLHLLVLDSMA